MEGDTSKTWDQLVLEKIASGVDPSIIRENLKLSPSQRIEKMQRSLALVAALRNPVPREGASSGGTTGPTPSNGTCCMYDPT